MPSHSLTLHRDDDAPSKARMVGLLESLGITVELGGMLYGDIDRPGFHIVWGMQQGVHVQRRLRRPSVCFAEQGWLAQDASFYLDFAGTNANSAIVGGLDDINPPFEASMARSKLVEQLHKGTRVAEEYILVPLQVENDTQIEQNGCLLGIPGMRQVRFVDFVCAAFPDEDIVIRPHPKDQAALDAVLEHSKGFHAHANIRVDAEGNSYQAVAKARAVCGVNSTVLIEALTYYKPVCAMGLGVFSDNSVVLEAVGDEREIANVLDWTPDRVRIDRFLDLLVSRQISYDITDGDAELCPVLMECLKRSQ